MLIIRVDEADGWVLRAVEYIPMLVFGKGVDPDNLSESDMRQLFKLLTPTNSQLGVSLVNYCLLHTSCGNMLTALLEGDLYEAVRRADVVTRPLLINLVDAIRFTFPSKSYGSKEKVAAWLSENKAATA